MCFPPRRIVAGGCPKEQLLTTTSRDGEQEYRETNAGLPIMMPQSWQGCAKIGPVTIGFVSPKAIQNCRTNPSVGATQVFLHPVYPRLHACQLLHLRLVVFLSEPPVSLMMHPLGPLWEGLRHVRTPSEPLPDRLRPT